MVDPRIRTRPENRIFYYHFTRDENDKVELFEYGNEKDYSEKLQFVTRSYAVLSAIEKVPADTNAFRELDYDEIMEMLIENEFVKPEKFQQLNQVHYKQNVQDVSSNRYATSINKPINSSKNIIK